MITTYKKCPCPYIKDSRKISFEAKPVFKDTYSFDKFTQIFADIYGDKSLEEELFKVCKNPQNLIGEGHFKRVYSIPGIKDYVLSVLKEKFNPIEKPTPFHISDNSLEKYNFGQPIAENYNGLTIAGKVDGKAHSIPNWSSEHDSFCINKKIQRAKAEVILKQLINISSFPVNAYEELAAKFKYLNECSIRVDPINPNNILIDKASKALNIVDIDRNDVQLPKPFNGVRDMEVLLLDSLLHKACKDALTDKKAENLTEVAKIIIEKCKAAAKNVNLKNNPMNTFKHFEFEQNYVLERFKENTFFVECYQNFLNLYKDIL